MKMLPTIHGESRVKLARDGNASWRTSWLYHYKNEKQFPYMPSVRSLRTEGWKYIHFPHSNGSPDHHLAERYDFKNDPGETKNLITDPAQNELSEKLKAELAIRMADGGLTPRRDQMSLDEGIKKELPNAKIR